MWRRACEASKLLCKARMISARILGNGYPTRSDSTGDRTTASERLLNRFRNDDNYWQGKAQTHFGLVLSGEKLVNDPGFRDSLLEEEPEAIGGEMEGAGLYAATREAKVDWILVKAICDWADGHKNDNAQTSAARNAAQNKSRQ